MTARTPRRFDGLNHPPGLRIGHQCRQNGMIKLVAAANGFVRGEQWLAPEREITNGVQHLVADEFVCKAQAFRIEYAIFTHNERVFERGAECIARAPQLGDVAHKSKSTGARDLAAERLRPNVE